MKVTRTPQGDAYLHIWRTGHTYEEQKGQLFRNQWTSVRHTLLLYPTTGPVLRRDVRKGLPFVDGTFCVAYVNHVFEHLTPAEAGALVTELHRVLEPGGICRISVPDLESAARQYLEQLEGALADESPDALRRYRWAVFELIDQIVRDRPGGLMKQAIAEGDFDDEYMKVRYGDVFGEFRSHSARRGFVRGAIRGVRQASVRELLYAAGRRLQQRLFVRGDPRRSGEGNRWMWDRLSLKLLLTEHGFEGAEAKRHDASNIPGWERYRFDTSEHGDYPLEPSVYVEAVKA